MTTQERVKQCLHYNAETGSFIWLVANSSHPAAGSIAGGLTSTGYWRIALDGRRYKAHRLAWLYMIGEWPRAQIDHINGDRLDNRWINLREASQIQNSANMRTRDSNLIGIKGVSLYRGIRGDKYRAHIFIRGKTIYLGSFDSAHEAATVYVRAAEAEWGQYARAA